MNTSESAPRPRVRRREAVLLVAASLLCCGALLELGARAWSWSQGKGFWSRPHSFISPFFVSYDWPPPRFEGDEAIFRLGERVKVRKAPGELRVICLGGSTTVNSENAEGVAYSREFEIALAPRFPEHRLVVLNAGGDAFSSAHSLVNFSLRQLPLEPDAVTILENINDLSAQNFGERLLPDYANKYLDDAFLAYEHRAGLGGALLRHSRAAQLLKWRIGLLKSLAESSSRGGRVANPDDGLAAFGRNLRSLVAVARAQGVTPLLITQSHRDGESAFQGEFGRYNDAVRVLAAEQGVALVDASRQLSGHPENFLDDVHMTADGLRKLSALIAPTLEEALRQRLDLHGLAQRSSVKLPV